MDNKKSYVYKIMCKITGEFYFGSSFNAKSDSYWGSGRKIKERIAQYGKENFVKEILGEFNDRTIALQVENQYIEKFINDEKCLNKRLEHHFGLYGEESRTKIGAANAIAMLGKHLSADTRARIGAAQLGKNLSEECKARISSALCGEKNPMFGKHLSEDHRAKIGAAQLGKTLSEEHRAKIGDAHRGKHWRKNPITGKREWYDYS